MSALTRLQALSLQETDLSEGMELLARLPRLRSASFSNCSMLPGCLSMLTGLQQLCIHSMDVHASDSQALLHLTQLTCLALMLVTDRAVDEDAEDAALPAVLLRLPQLRALAWFVYMPPLDRWSMGQQAEELPAGAWLGRLQHLEAEYRQLAASLPFATSLRQLGVDADFTCTLHPEQDLEEVAGVLRCAAALPLLRDIRVHVNLSSATPPASVLEALDASPARARLHWLRGDLLDDSLLARLFYEEGAYLCHEEDAYPCG